MTANGYRFSDGRLAVVTGAASGIGRATVLLLAARGAQVLGVDQNPDGLESLAGEAGSGAVSTLTLDLTQADAGRQVKAAAAACAAPWRILVNNAAANPYFGPMLDLDWEAWDKTMEVNLKGSL